MEWEVKKTDSFEKWWKKEKVDSGNYKYYKKALESFKNILLPHNVQTCIFKNQIFECWEARLPDKIRKQGKSSGFRVVFILDLEENVMLLQGIFRRSNLKYKGQNGKYDFAYNELLKDLLNKFQIK